MFYLYYKNTLRHKTGDSRKIFEKNALNEQAMLIYKKLKKFKQVIYYIFMKDIKLYYSYILAVVVCIQYTLLVHLMHVFLKVK